MIQVVLLRGLNLGKANRIKMPELRAAIENAGLGSGVQSYVQSGNLLLDSAMGRGRARRRRQRAAADRVRDHEPGRRAHARGRSKLALAAVPARAAATARNWKTVLALHGMAG